MEKCSTLATFRVVCQIIKIISKIFISRIYILKYSLLASTQKKFFDFFFENLKFSEINIIIVKGTSL
jgi:hypothetical protein